MYESEINEQLYYRITGMIFGHALGDALGAPSEMINTSKNYTGILEHTIVHNSRFQGRREAVIGQVTDDTEMAIALIIAMTDGYSKERAIKEYLNWANGPPKCSFTGKNTTRLFKERNSTVTYNRLWNKYYNDNLQNESNGTLMRAYPLSVVDSKYIKIDVDLSNPNDMCRESTFIYVNSIKNALKGMSKEYIIDSIKSNLLTVKNEHIKDVLQTVFNQAITNTKRDVTTDNKYKYEPLRMKDKGKLKIPIYSKDVPINKGWIVHSLYCALWGFFNFDSYENMIDAVIGLAGDTDTNAAIAGALFGAFHGFEKLCKETTTRNNLKILIRAFPNNGDFKRPEIYHINIKNIFKYTSILYTNFVKNNEGDYI